MISSAASAASKEQRWKAKIIEDYDSQGRAILKRERFDPNDVHKKHTVRGISWTPLTYFCARGKLMMCRYLVARGADGRQANNVGYFPMYYAAAGGYVEIVRFLAQDGGAHEDIQRVNWSGTSPLRIALREDHLCVAKLLIRNDALSSPRVDVAHGGVIDDVIMRRDLFPNDPTQQWNADKRLPLLEWAQDTVTNHDNIHLFLKGTILPSSTFRRHPKNQYATRSKRMKISPSSTSSLSPLVLFKGKSNILELVAAYVETKPTPHELRLFRKLTERLPPLIAAVPFVDNYEE